MAVDYTARAMQEALTARVDLETMELSNVVDGLFAIACSLNNVAESIRGLGDVDADAVAKRLMETEFAEEIADKKAEIAKKKAG